MSSLPADYAFSLLVSVAGSALVDGPLYPVNKTGKSTSSSSSSSTSTSAKKQKKCKPPTKAQSSKGSTFTENFQGSQVVYRRPSVYFSIVKSSRKFPGYFNAAQKLIIVSWTKNISNDGPEPLDANSVVTARTSSNQVTRGWNYHQVKQWYFSLYQRLCATKKANEANLASAHAHSVSMRPVYSDGAPAGMQQQQTSGATNGRGTKRTYPGPFQQVVSQPMVSASGYPMQVQPGMSLLQLQQMQKMQLHRQQQTHNHMVQQQMLVLAQQEHHRNLLAEQQQQQLRLKRLQQLHQSNNVQVQQEQEHQEQEQQPEQLPLEQDIEDEEDSTELALDAFLLGRDHIIERMSSDSE